MPTPASLLRLLRVQLYVTWSCITDPVTRGITKGWITQRLGKTPHTVSVPHTTSTAPDAHIQPHIPADFPVDLVYTWVDGNDPGYIKTRALWAAKTGQKQAVSMDAVRFVDNCELKLSLRSVEKYLPWIRHIYIVTNDQTPDWLDTSHPKIRMVATGDIFPDSSDLPSFNSHAIEFQLHRIPGLSEHFIYCCDDMLFSQPCRKEDFFIFMDTQDEQRSKMKLAWDDYLFIYPAWIEYLRGRAQAMLWKSAWNNLKYRLESDFAGARIRWSIAHQAIALKKSMLASAAKRYTVLYKQVSASRFRSAMDIPPIGFACHLALLEDKAEITSVSSAYINTPEKLRACIQNGNMPKLLCINNFPACGDVCDHIADLDFCSAPSEFEK